MPNTVNQYPIFSFEISSKQHVLEIRSFVCHTVSSTFQVCLTSLISEVSIHPLTHIHTFIYRGAICSLG